MMVNRDRLIRTEVTEPVLVITAMDLTAAYGAVAKFGAAKISIDISTVVSDLGLGVRP